jgi:hypothetical protein
MDYSAMKYYLEKYNLHYFTFSPHSEMPMKIVIHQGCAIAQAISRWLHTAVARVRARVWSCEICGGQSGAEAGFLRVLRFPLPIFIPPFASQLPSSIIWGLYNRPEVGAVPSGLSPSPLIITVIHHLPQDTPAERISSRPEDLVSNVINMRQMTATRTAPDGQTDVETPLSIPCYLNKKHKISRDIKAEYLQLREALCSDRTAQTSAVSGPIARNPLDIFDAVVANCIWNAQKRKIQNLCRAAAVAS